MTDLFSLNKNHAVTNCHTFKTQAKPIPEEAQRLTNCDLLSNLTYKGKPIRRAKLEDGTEVWVVIDVIGAVIGTKNPRNYWYMTKRRMVEEGVEESTICSLLKIKDFNGKTQQTQVMTLPRLLRMLQSLPSKKAEPFRVFMAEAGYALIKEAKNPDLAIQRGYENYRKKGMTPEMAMKRAKSVLHRNCLTDQWKSHGISQPKEFALLTDRESRGIFGKTTSEMKKDRNLAPIQSLRDNMSLAELTAQDVGDTVISALITKNNPYGFNENAVEVDKDSAVGAEVLKMVSAALEC